MKANADKEFDLGDILSLTTGKDASDARLLSPKGIVGLRALISHMVGDNFLSDSATVELAPRCRSALLTQHPQLAQISVDGMDEMTGSSIDAWLDGQRKAFGEKLSVTAIL